MLVTGGIRLNIPSPLAEIQNSRLASRGVRLFLKRDDLIHPELAGNKWRKLRYNLEEATRRASGTLLTFGGAYSNHIRAVAAAGRYFGFHTVGVIRGEEHLPLNPVLRQAVADGMRITYLDRSAYRMKTATTTLQRLRAEFGDFYLLPEGGSNALAARGCAELPAEITRPFDVLCCSCGTGGTLAGIAAGLGPGQRAIGFSALRGAGFLADDVDRLQRDAFGANSGNWSIEHGFHFGGYARTTPELSRFIDSFAAHHGLTLEPIYEAKLLFGVFSMVVAGAFPPATTIVAVISA